MSPVTFVTSARHQSAVSDLSDGMSLLAGAGLRLYHCGTRVSCKSSVCPCGCNCDRLHAGPACVVGACERVS